MIPHLIPRGGCGGRRAPLAHDPEWSLKLAAEEWTAKGNTLADADDLRKATRVINGGLIGLNQRSEWLAKACLGREKGVDDAVHGSISRQVDRSGQGE